MTDADPILSEIEMFLEQSDMTPTDFGMASMKDPRFVFDLRAGRECRRATRYKVRQFIAGWRPPQPVPQPAEAPA